MVFVVEFELEGVCGGGVEGFGDVFWFVIYFVVVVVLVLLFVVFVLLCWEWCFDGVVFGFCCD